MNKPGKILVLCLLSLLLLLSLVSVVSISMASANDDVDIKLDPILRRLTDDQKSLEAVEIKSVDTIKTIPVIVQADSGKDISNELKGIEGVEVHSIIGDIITADVPVSSIKTIASIPGVAYIEASKPLKLLLDKSVPATKANEVWNMTYMGQNITGKGVIVAIIDTGIDWTHGDFKKPDGTSRILYIWDQTLTAQPGETVPQPYNYGVEYTQAEINAALEGNGTVREQDTNGHGTHCAGIAVGNGLSTTPPKYIGMAPEADIIVVKSNLTIDTVIDAMNYTKNKAQELGKPLVISCSFGAHWGAHDGTESHEKVIDTLSGEGTVFVVAAGNEADDKIHASGNVTQGGSVTTNFNIPYVPATGYYQIPINIWYEGTDSMSISVTTPGGEKIGPVAKGDLLDVNTPSGSVRIDARSAPWSGNGDNNIYVTIDNYYGTPVQTGTWSFTLTGVAITNKSGRFDAWLPAGGVDMEQFTTNIDPQITIGEPATANKAIAVGAYTTKPSSEYGRIARFSSKGPTRDGRQKPEITAPGRKIISARSGGDYTGKQGTSMSCPHVAGAVALMLQVNSTLDPATVSNIIKDTAVTDSFTGSTWNPTWGMGKLDAKAAVMRVLYLSDKEKPIVTSPRATPDTIAANGLDTSRLNVTVRDDSGIASVTVDLSALGGSATQTMTNIEGTHIYTTSTTAAVGTTPGTYYLPVNATDSSANANYNTSVSIPLTVRAARRDINVSTDYAPETEGIKITNATGAVIPAEQNLTIGETYNIWFRIVNEGDFNETVNVTIKITNGTMTVLQDSFTKIINISDREDVNRTWDTSGLTQDNYKITVNASITEDDDWSNNEGSRIITLVDRTPPAYSKVYSDNTEVGEPALLSAYWCDNTGLNGFILSTNNSGVWENTSYPMTGPCNWSNATIILNSTAHSTIGWIIYAKDTSGNWNNTGVQTILTADTKPPLVTSATANPPTIFADGAHTTLLNVTATDISGIKSVTVNLSSIGGSEKYELRNNSGVWQCRINTTVSGTFELPVNVTDNEGNSNTTVAIALEAVPTRADSIFTYRDSSLTIPANIFEDNDTVFVVVTDGNTTGGNKTITVNNTYNEPINVTVYDDGTNYDIVANDTNYTGHFKITSGATNDTTDELRLNEGDTATIIANLANDGLAGRKTISRAIKCFIATAAYGTPLHEDIEVLRDFRDEYLMTNPLGRGFVRVYYETSPPIAEVISEHEWLRTAVREGMVKPLVYIVRGLYSIC